MKESYLKTHSNKEARKYRSAAGIVATAAIIILTSPVWPSNEQSSPDIHTSASGVELEQTRVPVRQKFKDVVVDVEGESNMQVPNSADINFDASGYTIEFKGVKISRPSSDSSMSLILASKGKLDSSTRLQFRIDYQLEKESGKVKSRVSAELPYVSSKNICETIILGTDQSLVSLEEFLKPTDYKYVSDEGKVSIFVGGKLKLEKILGVANQACANNQNWIFTQSEGSGLQNATIEDVRISSHADKVKARR